MSLCIKYIVITHLYLPKFIKNIFVITFIRLTLKFLSEAGVFIDSSIDLKNKENTE